MSDVLMIVLFGFALLMIPLAAVLRVMDLDHPARPRRPRLSVWSRLHEAVERLARLFCRHPEGIVCAHRHWAYDQRLGGYHDGFAAASRRAARHERDRTAGPPAALPDTEVTE